MTRPRRSRAISPGGQRSRCWASFPSRAPSLWQQQQGAQQAPRQTHEAPNQPATDTKQPARAPRRTSSSRRGVSHRARARGRRHPARRAVGQRDRRGRAGVHRLRTLHGPTLDVETRTADARRARVARHREPRPVRSRLRGGDRARSGTRSSTTSRGRERVRPEMRHGAAFFARFRDMIARRLFLERDRREGSSVQGNTFIPVWNGCPEPALRKLGVSYDLMNKAEGRMSAARLGVGFVGSGFNARFHMRGMDGGPRRRRPRRLESEREECGRRRVARARARRRRREAVRDDHRHGRRPGDRRDLAVRPEPRAHRERRGDRRRGRERQGRRSRASRARSRSRATSPRRSESSSS